MINIKIIPAVSIILALNMFAGIMVSVSFSAEVWEMGPETAIYVSSDEKFVTDTACDGTNFLVVGHQISENEESPFPFAMLVSSEGIMINHVNLDISLPGIFPHVAFDGTKYMAVWTVFTSEEESDILAQFISTEGITIGSPFTIVEKPGSQEIGDIAFDGTSYLVIWTDNRNENRDIYGQIVTPSGNLIGSEIIVCTKLWNQKDPAVSTNGESFLVVWNDGNRLKLGHGEDIYGQMIDGNGELIGTNFIISQNDYPSDNPIGITTNGSQFFVAWMEETGGYESREWDIFGQLINSSGTLAGNEIRLVEKPGGQFFPALAFDGTNYLAIWTDMANDLNKNGYYDSGEGTGSDIIGMFLDISGNPAGGEFIISGAHQDQLGAGLCFGAGKYFTGWTDNRAGNHIIHEGLPYGDIYGVVFNKTVPSDVEKEPNPEEFYLSQNYPNPFNPNTTISYNVPASGYVKLTVCNSAGQKIAALVDSYIERGKYSVSWDGKHYSNGVYYCILEIKGHVAAQRMLLLK